MQIDKYGNDVGYEKRLQDIKIDKEKLTAIQGFYRKCTQIIENTKFLTMRFLHF